MPNILVVDPGQTTGLMVAEYDKSLNQVKLLHSGTVNWDSTIIVVRELALKHLGYTPSEKMVIERAPSMANNIIQLGRVLDTIDLGTELATKQRPKLTVQIISPGEWKPIAKARKWSTLIPLPTTHERDCLGMLFYTILRDYGKEPLLCPAPE